MFGAIAKFLLYRVLGARVMLALAALGFARRLLGGRRSDSNRKAGVYQPSQGSSQIVHRDPR